MVALITQRKNQKLNKNTDDNSAGAPQDFIDIFLKAEADEDDLKKIATERNVQLDRMNTKIEKKMTIDVSNI